MKSFCRGIAVAAVCLILSAVRSMAHAQTEAEELPYVVKVYRVADLVLPTPFYGFEGVRIPGVGRGTATSFGGMIGGMGGMGGMGSGMGGMGSGMGGMGGMGMGGGGTGGFFAVGDQMEAGGAPQNAGGPPDRTRSLRFTIDDLVDAIQATVEQHTWDVVGGEGNITELGGMLLISQTLPVHEQIGNLLNVLRQEAGVLRSVTIRAHWLLLDSQQRKRLFAENNRAQLIDHAVLEELTDSSGAWGQITCFDGQTVHIISGTMKSSVESVIPVVGQLDGTEKSEQLLADGSRNGQEATLQPTDTVRESQAGLPRHLLAQAGIGGSGMGAGGGSQPAMGMAMSRQVGVGYQPVSRVVNFGALLQVTPTLIPKSPFVVLDLQSTVTRPDAEEGKTVEIPGLMRLDRMNLVSQQFMTTLRLPLDRPTLVAGTTLQPMSQDSSQLYLVVEATVEGE